MSVPSLLFDLLTRWRRQAALARVADAAFVALATGGAAFVGLAAVGVPAGMPAMTTAGVAMALFLRRPPTRAVIAASLDARHGLADLLATAWASRDDGGPWASAVRGMADARAATLPALGWPGRFGGRHFACVAAAVVAGGLATTLVSESPPAAGMSASAAITDADTRVAAVVRRATETADEAGRAFSVREDEPAATRAGDRVARGDLDTAGAGRADAAGVADIAAPRADGSAAGPTRLAVGRSGRASGTADTGAEATGRVLPAAAAGPSRPAAFEPAPATPAAGRTTAGDSPAAYRDMVRDFFER